MHQSAYQFVENYLKDIPNIKLKILDVGSQRVQKDRPAYRDLMKSNWEYTGYDIVAGDNVDTTEWNFKDNEFDIVISGSAIEHCKNPFRFVKDIYYVTKGSVCIVAPSSGPIHWGKDYLRIMPDGMRELLESSGFKNIEIFINNNLPWKDCCGTANK